MVWAPNVGIAYPFTPGANISGPPTSGSNLVALDTNQNGVVDFNDDPYGPYYPGDSYVDWVGLSLYYYPLSPDNPACPSTFFVDYMNGVGPTVDDIVSPSLRTAAYSTYRNFYQRFAAAKGKPMMLPESGAPFLRSMPANAGEISIKTSWWQQIFSANTLQQYPNLKLYVNFEEAKTESGYVRDWAVTVQSDVAAAFTSHINSFKSSLLTADQLTYACDGSIKIQ
jgi:hypothetical protein